MTQKSIPDLICEKFKGILDKDKLFEGLSEELFSKITQKKVDRKEIEKLLKGEEDED